MYRIGMDVGSTTLKTVVLNEENKIIEKSYRRHFSRVREESRKRLRELRPLLEGELCQIAITGSAGLGIAETGELPFVQEVFSTAGAVRRLYPDCDIVIELGGEDAKILFLQGAVEERMNGSCAGGTGSFIDQMAVLLNCTAGELDELSQKHTKLYPIASRCGVFAKTDVQALLNQGAKKEDIAASIFQAVVEQTITALAQGRKLEGKILFLGGPLHFLKGLGERFVESLHLTKETAIFPELAPYFVALGAAFQSGEEKALSYEELLAALDKEPEVKERSQKEVLFEDEVAYARFCERHASYKMPERPIEAYEGPAYLGIDSGSTTVKLVLLDEGGSILHHFYAPSQGRPLDLLLEELKKVRRLCGDRVEICSSAVTGYGEELMQTAFGIDFGLVETMAHYRGAKHFHPEVDFIIDIGGQDIKCFHIRKGNIDAIVLNEACSSGCGSFLESFAKSMGYKVQDFAEKALFAKNPAELGSRCTVFMNSSVKQAQKEGAELEDIAAGLAQSVIKNAIYKVIRARSPEELGEHIVVQGGTFRNDAVLRCFEMELGREVIRFDHSELMGAYGAALYAKDLAKESSKLLDLESLESFTTKTKLTRCGLCSNHCQLSIHLFPGKRRFILGNKCEKGAGKKARTDLPNLVAKKQAAMQGSLERKNLRIGLPRGLNIYEMLPFWRSFFENLGCEIVLSEVSTRQTYMRGQASIPSDTVCYPAKLMHGHVLDLAEKGVDAIFYPCMSYTLEEGSGDNHYNCPVVAYYPELLEANLELDPKIPFLHPHLGFQKKALLAEQLEKALRGVLEGITRKEIRLALEKAFLAYAKAKAAWKQEGQRALSYAKEKDLAVIVLAGRPYQVDPEINHGLDRVLNGLGFVVLTEDSLPLSKTAKSPPLGVLNQWGFHARMYEAAKFVCQHRKMELLQLVNFGCGIDAVTSDEIREILESHGKLYTQLKIDEIHNLGAAKIRLRSLEASMKEREAKR